MINVYPTGDISRVKLNTKGCAYIAWYYAASVNVRSWLEFISRYYSHRLLSIHGRPDTP